MCYSVYMEIYLSYVQGRTARADVRGGILHVRMPKHWPVSEKEAALLRFKRWAARRSAELATLPPAAESPPLSLPALIERVRRINAETLGVELRAVRLGSARFTRLAQANYKTKTLTFSRFAVNGLPERALRYLILHELAHLIEPNHSERFWALVYRHEPEWKLLRRQAQAHFQRAADQRSRESVPTQTHLDREPGALSRAITEPGPRGMQLSLFPTLATELPVR